MDCFRFITKTIRGRYGNDCFLRKWLCLHAQVKLAKNNMQFLNFLQDPSSILNVPLTYVDISFLYLCTQFPIQFHKQNPNLISYLPAFIIANSSLSICRSCIYFAVPLASSMVTKKFQICSSFLLRTWILKVHSSRIFFQRVEVLRLSTTKLITN